MRHRRIEPLSDVLNHYLQALGLDKKINEVRLINSWEETVGKIIAKSTTNIFIRNGVLEVHIRSSVIKNELLLLKDGLIQALNDKVGNKVIHDIVLR
ncbi:MAG: DUF721 domain-containing protein [Bacteroidota bacterium]|nr:DUF721 domain-containing protein [Bacteroidota bacterium]